MSQGTTPPGWYYAEGDPPNTQRYWDGNQWIGEPQTLSPTTGVPGMAYTPTPGPQLASPGIRFAARLIDWIFVNLLTGALIQLVGLGPDMDAIVESLESGDFDPDVFRPGVAAILATVAFGFLWEFLWTAFAAGTPVKLLLGLRVADASNQQYPPSPLLAARRSLNRLIVLMSLVGLSGIQPLITFLIGSASLVMLFTDEKHRTVMDRVGGTIVVKKQ